MARNKASGSAIRPTTEQKLRTSPVRVATPGLPNKDDTCQGIDCKQHPLETIASPSVAADEEGEQNLEFSNEDEFTFEEVRLELFRRKELALLELKKIVAESSKGQIPSKNLP